jgi:hypothetical protein
MRSRPKSPPGVTGSLEAALSAPGPYEQKSAKVDPPPLPEGTISTRAEHKQVEERLAIGANVVYETIRREGEDELHRTAAALAWSALAAGLSMGFSFVAEGLLMSHLPDQPWLTVDCFRWILRGISHCHPGTPATIYRKYSDRRLAALVAKGPVYIAADATFVGSRIEWKPGGHIFVRSVHRQNRALRSSHPGIPHTDRCRSHRSKFLDRASACGFRGMVDCFNGMAPSRSRIRARQHRRFNHIIAGSTTMFFLIVTKTISWGTYVTQFFIPTPAG